MIEERVPYTLMDDLEVWRRSDPRALFAGVNFLFDTVKEQHPKSFLVRHVLNLGSLKHQLEARYPDPQMAPAGDADIGKLLKHLNALGTVGYGLWHLKNYMDSAAFRDELEEFSKYGDVTNPNGNRLRLLGQGFLFYASGVLARDGFAIEFIPQSKKPGERRPDFYALRDGNRFPCEATSKSSPARTETVKEFWQRIVEVVEAKRTQFRPAEFSHGVLLVDCTPVYGLMALDGIPIGGELFHMSADDKGPPGGSVPLIRYDDSDFSRGLHSFQEAIKDSGIRNVILWRRVCEVSGNDIEKKNEYRVLGTIEGGRFWSYFPKALVFPGPNVQVTW
jgi:hypothetical protein